MQLQVRLSLVTNGTHFLFAVALDLVDFGFLGAFLFQRRHILFHLLGALFDVQIAVLFDLLPRQIGFLLHIGQVLVATFLIDLGNHVGREVNDLFQVLRSDIQQVTETGGHALEVPNMRHRGSEFNVTHPLAAHLGTGDFHPAAFADNALVTHALVLAAGTFPVAGRPENPFIEQAFFLRLQRPVVDGFRLLNFAVGPAIDVVLSR